MPTAGGAITTTVATSSPVTAVDVRGDLSVQRYTH